MELVHQSTRLYYRTSTSYSTKGGRFSSTDWKTLPVLENETLRRLIIALAQIIRQLKLLKYDRLSELESSPANFSS